VVDFGDGLEDMDDKGAAAAAPDDDDDDDPGIISEDQMRQYFAECA
jgi:hypothetical protein